MALGLAEYRKRKAEEDARREAASRPKIQRFALAKDGDSAVIRFAQEIDFDAKNYSEERGIGFVNIFHDARSIDPKNGWKNSASCTMDSQGACLPCELANDYSVEWDNRKGWRQKEKFYINVIGGEPAEVQHPQNADKKMWVATDIDRDTGDGTVYLLEQSPHNGIYDALATYFLEEEVSGGTITDKYFKITRKGSKFNDTSYGITPLKDIPEGAKSLDDFELYDVKEDVLNEVPYAQQDAFYHKGVEVAGGAVAGNAEERTATTGSTPTGTEDSW